MTDPSQKPLPHGCLSGADHDREVPEIDLVSPLTIRGITLRNRIVMSPMCQYIAQEGLADDWHLVHLGSRAVGGVALVMVEATSVARDGRITPGDLGIWSEQHIEPLARIARFVHSQGAVAGIQLAHAGRKASCDLPWNGGAGLLTSAAGGWNVVGPSAVPFDTGNPVPRALDEAGIDEIVAAFEAGATPRPGGGFPVDRDTRRPRLLVARIPFSAQQSPHRPLRRQPGEPLSPDAPRGRGGPQAGARRAAGVRPHLGNRLGRRRLGRGAFGGAGGAAEGAGHRFDRRQFRALVPKARIPVSKGYQVPFGARIRCEAGVMTGAVGLITEAAHANEIVTGGDADLVFIARELLREPYWALKAEQELGSEPSWPISYGYAVKRRWR